MVEFYTVFRRHSWTSVGGYLIRLFYLSLAGAPRPIMPFAGLNQSWALFRIMLCGLSGAGNGGGDECGFNRTLASGGKSALST
jgi:hypothetical protein